MMPFTASSRRSSWRSAVYTSAPCPPIPTTSSIALHPVGERMRDPETLWTEKSVTWSFPRLSSWERKGTHLPAVWSLRVIQSWRWNTGRAENQT